MSLIPMPIDQLADHARVLRARVKMCQNCTHLETCKTHRHQLNDLYSELVSFVLDRPSAGVSPTS